MKKQGDRSAGWPQGWLTACADLFFPPLCLGCGRFIVSSLPPQFCVDCQKTLPFVQEPLCLCCGTPFVSGKSHICGACLRKPPSFHLARSLFLYEEPISRCIISLKFAGELYMLKSLQALMAVSESMQDLSKPDWVVPVPLHAGRLRERGFNQALLLCRACFPQWRRLIRTDILLRSTATIPQSQLTGTERRRNLRGAFQLRHSAEVRNKNVLLVDDVFTTGSTMAECSSVFRAAGARRIEVFTLARSVKV